MNDAIRSETPVISVVVPLFNEETNLAELYRRLARVLDDHWISFEIVLVDDGSRDATPRLAQALHASDPRVTVLTLSRNFGHQAALTAGLDHARGQAVILMDGDLQDPPEVLPQLIDAWRQGNDVVYAVRTKRKESLVKRACYALFYRIFRRASDLDIPLDSGDFCLMDRKVVDALGRLPERNRFLRGLRAFVGFRQIGVAYERAARGSGETKYTLHALCRLALDGIIGFSTAPLRCLTWLAAACLVTAILGGVGTFFLALAGASIAGWWIATLAFVGCTGLQLLGLGILGEYVGRILIETKGRPSYVIGSIQEAPASQETEESAAIQSGLKTKYEERRAKSEEGTA